MYQGSNMEFLCPYSTLFHQGQKKRELEKPYCIFQRHWWYILVGTRHGEFLPRMVWARSSHMSYFVLLIVSTLHHLDPRLWFEHLHKPETGQPAERQLSLACWYTAIITTTQCHHPGHSSEPFWYASNEIHGFRLESCRCSENMVLHLQWSTSHQ